MNSTPAFSRRWNLAWPVIFLLAAALVLLLAPALHAGKSQQLTSPDQVPEGLAKSDWQSIRAAHEAWQHEFRQCDGKWQARNPGQRWTTTFDGRGFLAQPKEAAWTWGLELKSYGFGSFQIMVKGRAQAAAAGQRLTYRWSGGLEEWFVNDSRGLEHGFTLASRPRDAADGEPLVFTLATLGDLKPSVASDMQTVHFRDDAGAPVLSYSGLKVWDADGKTLPSRFASSSVKEFRLVVVETGARYPLTIDPIAQQAYLKAGNNGPESNDRFGTSVAVSGDTVVVGAREEDSSTTGVNSTPDEGTSAAGAAYIFTGLGPPPLLDSVSPSTGSPSGGTTLTITGSGFTGATSVLIGGIPATSFTVNSATSITATTPAHLPGIVDVEVTTPVGIATGSGLFTYAAPEIAVEGPNGNDLTSGTSTVDFGGVLTNAPASRTFVIRNTGNVPLGELAVSIGGTHDEEFVAVQPPGTVNGGGSTTFTITFTPAANGLRSATLLIASDDENEDPFEIALIGTGSTAQQLLEGYATSAGLIGLDTEPGATPYKDGVPNLLKYAFNMNAAGPDRRTLVPGTGTVGLPVLRIVSGNVRYEFLRRKNSGLIYTPQQSSNLSGTSWQAATGTTTVTSIDENRERVEIQQAPGTARFFRVTVGL
jgi:hypothetical protein